MKVNNWVNGFVLPLIGFAFLVAFNSSAWSQQFQFAASNARADTVPAKANARFSDDGRLLVDNEILRLLDLDEELELDATGRLFDLETKRWLRENDARYRKVMEFVDFFNTAKKSSPSKPVASKSTNPAVGYPVLGQYYSTPAGNVNQGQQLPTYAPSPSYVPQPSSKTPEAMLLHEMKAMRVALEAQSQLLTDMQAKVDRLSEELEKVGRKKSRSKKSGKK